MRAQWLVTWVPVLGLVAGEAVRSRRLAVELHTAQDQATHDPLTGLLNRAGMGTQADRAVAEHGAAALLLVDLDHFKVINDSYGHAAGDAVLREVAVRISAVLMPQEYAGRHGGDEFSVLTPVRPGPWMRSRSAALAEAVRGPMTLPDGSKVVVQASVGTAVAATSPAVSAEMAVRQLWEAADRSMYRDKAERRGERPSRRRWSWSGRWFTRPAGSGLAAAAASGQRGGAR